MNNKSNISLLLKKYLVENKKMITYYLCGFILLCIGIGLWFGYLGVASESELIWYVVLGTIGLYVLASLMFSQLKSKQGIINSIMTPATVQAKFWPRLLTVIPVGGLLVFGGFYVTDLFRVLMIKISTDIWVNFADPFTFVSNKDNLLMVCALFFSGSIFSVMLYFLGSALWPRLSFVKTMIVIFALQTVLSMSLGFLFRLNLGNLSWMNSDAFIYSLAGFLFLLACLAAYLAYRRFRSYTLATNTFGKK